MMMTTMTAVVLTTIHSGIEKERVVWMHFSIEVNDNNRIVSLVNNNKSQQVSLCIEIFFSKEH